MGVWEVLLLGLALSMDACAVGMTNGMTNPKLKVKGALLIGGLFGFFQFLMPLIGYYITGVIASAFLSTFEKISAWVSFALLGVLGGKMIFECVRDWIKAKREKAVCQTCFSDSDEVKTTEAGMRSLENLSFGKLILQAIATSIDALAVGVTLQMSAISQGLVLGAWGSTLTIGVTTFILSTGAVYIGKAIGDKLADKASFFGGLVLVAIGLKILLEGIL